MNLNSSQQLHVLDIRDLTENLMLNYSWPTFTFHFSYMFKVEAEKGEISISSPCLGTTTGGNSKS